MPRRSRTTAASASAGSGRSGRPSAPSARPRWITAWGSCPTKTSTRCGRGSRRRPSRRWRRSTGSPAHDHHRAVPCPRPPGRHRDRRPAPPERRPAARAAGRRGRRAAPARGGPPRPLRAGRAGRPPGGRGGEPRAGKAPRRGEPGHAARRDRRRPRRRAAARRAGHPGRGRAVTAPPIRAVGLTRWFAGTPVLGHVDLTVAAGELVVLLGPNGAGKTTLLRVLAGLLRPSGGELALFGVDVRRGADTVRGRLGYVGHETACYPDLTGAENLAFYAALFALRDARARIAELLAWAGLEAAAHRRVRTYSRGTQHRLALAPALLLLDEPFTGLDPEAAERLAARLAALGAEGCALVLVTHDLERTAPLATRTAVLHRGRIVWQGTGDAAAIAAAYRAAVGEEGGCGRR